MGLFRHESNEKPTHTGVAEVPKPPRERPGSPFVELPPEEAQKAQELIEVLRREVAALDTAQVIHEKKAEDIYRAPELGEKYSSDTPKYTIKMLEQLVATGRLNFWDASLDISRDFLNGKKFSNQETLAYGEAVDRVVSGLGLDVKNVPQAT